MNMSNYLQLVLNPKLKSKGVGSLMIDKLKEIVDFSKFSYITLETDAIDNEGAICFYEKMALRKKEI